MLLGKDSGLWVPTLPSQESENIDSGYESEPEVELVESDEESEDESEPEVEISGFPLRGVESDEESEDESEPEVEFEITSDSEENPLEINLD